jgi:hypothetical protein
MFALRRPYLLIDEAMVNKNTTFNVKQTSIGSILLILFFVFWRFSLTCNEKTLIFKMDLFCYFNIHFGM